MHYILRARMLIFIMSSVPCVQGPVVINPLYHYSTQQDDPNSKVQLRIAKNALLRTPGHLEGIVTKTASAAHYAYILRHHRRPQHRTATTLRDRAFDKIAVRITASGSLVLDYQEKPRGDICNVHSIPVSASSGSWKSRTGKEISENYTLFQGVGTTSPLS